MMALESPRRSLPPSAPLLCHNHLSWHWRISSTFLHLPFSIPPPTDLAHLSLVPPILPAPLLGASVLLPLPSVVSQALFLAFSFLFRRPFSPCLLQIRPTDRPNAGYRPISKQFSPCRIGSIAAFGFVPSIFSA